MMSAHRISKEKLQGLLANIAASQQKVAESIDALAARVKDISINQAEEAAVAITTKMGHVRGLSEITQAFNQVEIGLILVTGARKMHEYQCLKGKREEVNIITYSQLEKKYSTNRQNIIECSQGYKYRYPKGIPTKVQFTLTKPEAKQERQGAEAEVEKVPKTQT